MDVVGTDPKGLRAAELVEVVFAEDLQGLAVAAGGLELAKLLELGPIAEVRAIDVVGRTKEHVEQLAAEGIGSPVGVSLLPGGRPCGNLGGMRSAVAANRLGRNEAQLAEANFLRGVRPGYGLERHIAAPDGGEFRHRFFLLRHQRASRPPGGRARLSSR